MNNHSTVVRIVFSTALFAILAVYFASFANAAGGDYSLSFSAADPDHYERYLPGQLPCPALNGVAADPLNPPSGQGIDQAKYGDPKDSIQSLNPRSLALGQIVAFEVLACASGSTAPEGGKIRFNASWSTHTTNGDNFGFDPAYGVYCAFVDPSDPANKNLDGNENVSAVSSSLSGTKINGLLAVDGLDDGDCAVVEIWTVLKDSIPSTVGGNVQSELGDAETTLKAKINTGNQTIPLNKVKDFLDRDADLGIQKSDSPDPVQRLANVTYKVEASNYSGSTVANGVIIVDTLDPNTQFVSASVSDIIGSITTCTHDGAAAGGVLTCQAGFLNPLETVTITIISKVLNSALIGIGGSAPCKLTANESLCNRASIDALSTDTNSSNDTTSQPTGVTSPAPLAAISINKMPDAKVVYSGDLVIYTYEVSNSGAGSAISVSVLDDKCSPVDRVLPDFVGNGDALLEPGEKWHYECKQRLTVTTTNIGTVEATDQSTLIALQGSNQATVKVIAPEVQLMISPPAGCYISGTPIAIEYHVRNSGNDQIDDLIVTDSGCGPIEFSSIVVGNADAFLDPGEEWKFTCSATLSGPLLLSAVVTGTDSKTNSYSTLPVTSSVCVLPTPTGTPTLTATNTPIETPTPTATPTNTETATASPTNTPENTATSAPTITATSTPTNTASATPVINPLVTATIVPSSTPTKEPLGAPTISIAATPSPVATPIATTVPTAIPTPEVSCTSKLITETLFALDGAAHDQLDAINKVARNILIRKQSARTRIFVAQIQQEATALQLSNWNLTWSIPSVQAICTGSDVQNVCVTTSNEGKLGTYIEQALKLRDLLSKILVRAQKLHSINRKTSTVLTSLGEKGLAKALSSIKSVPNTYTVCG